MSTQQLMTVEYDEGSDLWTVHSRPAEGRPWVRYEGLSTELDNLLGLARDVMTGG